MKVIETKIPEVLIFEPRIFKDERGWFMESFNHQVFEQALHERGFDVPTFVQDNHSVSSKGVLRGLHYQRDPYAQGKLVRVVQGRAFDVAVDIRPHSPTFKQWVGVELDTQTHRQLWIPAGFAHGFLALEDNTQFLYKTTQYYHKESEVSLKWSSPDFNIQWPIEQLTLLLNERDASN